MFQSIFSPNIVQRQIIRILKLQTLLIFGCVMGFILAEGFYAGLSAFLGGLIALVPAFFHGWRVGLDPQGSASHAHRNFIRGQLSKYFFTVILFSLTFKIFDKINFLALFSSYILSLLVYFIALLIFRDKA